MSVLFALLMLVPAQDAKPVQGRDAILAQDIEQAIKRLGSDRFTQSFVAAEELREIGRRAVPALVAELNKRDATPAVKRALCEILGAIREPNRDAVSALTSRLKDADEYGTSVASAAARALTLIGDDSALPALLELIDTKDRVLKYEVIRAAGVFRAEKAVDGLKKALEDKKSASAGDGDDAPLIASAAADALGLIRAQGAVEDLGSRLSDVTPDPASGQTLGVHAARALQRILEHELRGKTEKDEPRLGVLSGDPNDVKVTLEAWQKWWTSKTAVKNIADTKERITKIEAAIKAFKAEQGSYPLILEHLKAKPESAKTWPKDGYYAGDLKDAWGMNLIFRAPGTGAEFDVVSYGGDRRAWGGGDGADLWNHSQWRDAIKAKSKAAIEEAVKAIQQFKADNERLPDQMLDLVVRPGYTLKKWPAEGYLKAVPKDGYDNYLLYFAGRTPGEAFDVVSPGADGVEGGTDENEDLWNHDKRPAKQDEKK